MSKKKQALQREENAALAADIEQRLTSLKEKFAAVENEKDPAKKIIGLIELNYTVANTGYPVVSKVSNIAYRRTKGSPKSVAKKGALTLASLTIVGLLFTPDFNWYSNKNKAKKERELRELLDVGNFEKAVGDYQRRAAKMLEDTVRNCDLKEVIKSPYYPEALDSSEPLKKRLEAVAFARAAFGDEASAPEATAPERKSSPAPRSPASYPELKL